MIYGGLLQQRNRMFTLLQQGVCSRKSNNTSSDNSDALLTYHARISHEDCSHNADYTRSYAHCQLIMLFWIEKITLFSQCHFFLVCLRRHCTVFVSRLCEQTCETPTSSLQQTNPYVRG